MGLAQRLRNGVRGVLQLYGTQRMKQRMWNREFASGRWACLESVHKDCVYEYVEKYARDGCILDLGCGPGSLGSELSDSYRYYTGVDISDVAIVKAKRRTTESGRTKKNEFVQSDIVSYVPQRRYDVILFGDSMYYVPRQHLATMLSRYSQFVADGGVFIARLFDVTGRRGEIVEVIEKNFDVVEKQSYDSRACVIVFRSRDRESRGPAFAV